MSASGIGEDLDLGLAADPRRPITGHVVTSVIHGAPSTPILDFYVLQSGRSISDFTPSGNDVPLLAAGFYNLTGLTFELTVAESDSNTVLQARYPSIPRWKGSSDCLSLMPMAAALSAANPSRRGQLDDSVNCGSISTFCHSRLIAARIASSK